MALENYGRIMQGAADFAMQPYNALQDARREQRTNTLLDLRAQGMQNELDDDAEWDQAYAARDINTLRRIDPTVAGVIEEQWRAEKMAGLEEIPVRQPIDMKPLQAQENWAANFSAQRKQNATQNAFEARRIGLQEAQEARLSGPQQGSDGIDFTRYAAMSPEERALYDQFRGRKQDAPPAALAPDAVVARQQDAENVLSSIDDAEGMAGFFTTGLVGSVLADVPGSNAYDLRTAIDTIKANIGFDRLTRMREESKTGGALGQVTERELSLLQAVIDSLDANQSETQLRVGLQRVRKQYERAMGAYEQMLQQNGQQPQANPATGMPPVEQRVKSYYGGQ
jgi:tetratricopeptide (TPR) repeat protein